MQLPSTEYPAALGQSFHLHAMAGGADGSAGDDARLIFVYGTLKRGFYNHTLIEDLIRTGGAAYVGTYTTVETFPLVCGPHGIPYLINRSGSGLRIRGEIYSVSSPRGISRLDELEGVDRGHYERLPVSVAEDGGGERVVEAEAYFAHSEFGDKLWRRCGELGFREYSVEMGEKYVRKEDRPLHSSFLVDINRFISEGNSSSSSSS